MGDVALITCKKGVGKAGMPSKTLSIMACDTPIIASFDTDSELTDILNKIGAGVCVEPENAEALIFEIGKHINRPRNYDNIREKLLQNISKDICIKNYLSSIYESII